LWQLVVASPEETVSLGHNLGRLVREGDIICLSGDLGSGKTTLVRGIAAGLGVDEPATSPSFTLVHEYQGRLPMYHLDLYRLEPEAGWDLGLGEYLGRGVTVVEWPEKLGTLLPPEHLWVNMELGAGENERLLGWKARGSRHRRLLEGLRRRCASWAWKRRAER
jgi:tRNA threonylcarbamoyladenosine biosynthesis protein TsaE